MPRTRQAPAPVPSAFLSPAEVAAILRVDVRSVRRWCADGTEGNLPGSRRIGKEYRIPMADLARLTGQEPAALAAALVAVSS